MLENTIIPITVVIPCFRCGATIGRAVTSIAQQTQRPAEIILVDDASGDGTLKVLRELKQTYPGWIKVLQSDNNRGTANSRNTGWAIATQPYITFLDADDSWHTEKLHIQYDYMRNNPDVALCGHQCVWLRDGETPPAQPKHLHATKISAGSLLFKNAFSTPTVMLRHDIPFRFQEGKRYAEDLLLWQQIVFAGLQVVRIESPLAYVHKPLYGAGGLSAQLWEMEKGELDNFCRLYQDKQINYWLYLMATIFSLLKFYKRSIFAKVRTR